MGALFVVPLLTHTCEAMTLAVEESERELRKIADRGDANTALVNSFRVATTEYEVSAVGIFSLFEARMQDRLEPEQKPLKAIKTILTQVGEEGLFETYHQLYLAVNVMKHGRGPNYARLLKFEDLPFALKPKGEAYFEEGDIAEPEGLIDFRSPAFFDLLRSTLDKVHDIVAHQVDHRTFSEGTL
jgi:hypothetical protein